VHVKRSASLARQAALASVHAFEKADLAAMKHFCAPGFIDYGNGESKPVKNLDSMKVSMDEFYAAFPDQKVTNLQQNFGILPFILPPYLHTILLSHATKVVPKEAFCPVRRNESC